MIARRMDVRYLAKHHFCDGGCRDAISKEDALCVALVDGGLELNEGRVVVDEFGEGLDEFLHPILSRVYLTAY